MIAPRPHAAFGATPPGLLALLVPLGLLAGLALAPPSRAQEVRLLADLATTEVSGATPSPSWFRALGSNAVFLAASPGLGSEPWVSDGTAAGTVRLADVHAGIEGQGWVNATSFGTSVVFAATDAAHGNEPWITDGTPEGTRLLRDIRPGPESSDPGSVIEHAGRVYFQAVTDEHGRELWASDGTTAGTQLVIDLWPGPESSNLGPIAELGGLLLANGSDGVVGGELWLTDGTAAGTTLLADLAPGPANAWVYDWSSTSAGLFLAVDTLALGGELYITDGTTAGTRLVADILPGVEGSFPAYLTALGGDVLFGAWGPVGGDELWRSDGTAAGTALVADINPGPDGSSLRWLAPIGGGRFLFDARTAGEGREPWITDGTTGGTVLLADAWPGPDGDAWGGWSLAGEAFFVADDGVNGREWWVTDGTPAGTRLFADLLPGPDGVQPRWPRVIGSRLWFGGGTASGGRGPWTCDGTVAGTAVVAELHPPGRASSVPDRFVAVRDFVAFRAHPRGPSSTFSPLYRTDGSSGGTLELTDSPDEQVRLGDVLLGTDGNDRLYRMGGADTSIVRLESAVRASSLTPAGDVAVFRGSTFDGEDHEPWVTDGTAAGTLRLGDLEPGSVGSDPKMLAAVDLPSPLGTRVFFAATTSATGREPWSTDGTPAGTSLVAELVPGVDGATFGPAVAADGRLYFVADDGATGAELWTSDGTAAGTVRLTDIRAGAAPSLGMGHGDRPGWRGSPRAGEPQWAALGGRLLFAAPRADGEGDEPWITDGTPAGTAPLADLRAGADGSYPQSMASIGGLAWLSADDGVAGRELWVSDGTSAGTRLVADLRPGPGSSDPAGFVELVDGRVAFAADDGVAGRELWVSDGTAGGTSLLADVAPGAYPSNPTSLTPWRGLLLFAAGDEVVGIEPRVFDPGTPGWVPDGATVPGVPLRVARAAGGDVTLSWGASCSSIATDYFVEEGTIGDFLGHAPIACSTGGATTLTATPSGPGVYWLVGPRTAELSGGLGRRSDGTARPAPAAPCAPPAPGSCP